MEANMKELQKAISELPEGAYGSFRDWFIERDWAIWDKQIEADSESGKLDHLIDQAIAEKAAGIDSLLFFERIGSKAYYRKRGRR